MTEKEYYYNVELLKLLDNIIWGNTYVALHSIIDLKERLDNIFDEERRDTK